ncbi:DUF2062 domain-containing protein [Paracoccus tegillarcae]|uniref:DUF2062 domain-containing protein n=1 Tax=Paracoccus tegillarcae TaxID=1529068 RepID=A0A2K9ERV4_9RHOB|nr:DUF2062 domain-containing protein [Paracoccus tegillarcae]AUH34445.1 DUF2062 domain-containing protein [Paracoccus tegillarcae]
MFKRRTPRSYGQIASDMIYPRGGWRRAGTYVLHRVRRLPDHPHRIARGVAAGVGVSFTPLFGFHFLCAAAMAWLIGGNVLAALLATFAINPVTVPFVAVLCLTTGRFILGLHGDLGPQMIFGEFSRASEELWNNILAPFGPRDAHWGHLADFFQQIFWPYMIGGLIWGTIIGAACHYLTVPVIRAYHKRRVKKMEDRIAKLRQIQARQGELKPPATAPDRKRNS